VGNTGGGLLARIKGIHMSQASMAGLTTVIALVTAALTLGDSAVKFLSPSERPSEEKADTASSNSEQPNVQHVVEHRAGTQKSDVLTGVDDLVINKANFGRGDAEVTLDSVSEGTFEFVEPLCSPYPYRIHNTADQYFEGTLAVWGTDNMSKIGIGPGERYVASIKEPNYYIVFDNDRHVYAWFQVEDCKAQYGEE
jgi:hypothetical protein